VGKVHSVNANAKFGPTHWPIMANSVDGLRQVKRLSTDYATLAKQLQKEKRKESEKKL